VGRTKEFPNFKILKLIVYKLTTGL